MVERYPQIKISVDYKKKRKTRGFSQIINIEHLSRPKIILPGEFGICYGQHRVVEPVVEVRDPAFANKRDLQLLWLRVIEETTTSREKLKAIALNVQGYSKWDFMKSKYKWWGILTGLIFTRTQNNFPVGKIAK